MFLEPWNEDLVRITKKCGGDDKNRGRGRTKARGTALAGKATESEAVATIVSILWVEVCRIEV